MPKRAVTISCPIHRDDGTIAVFEGYRVQHHLVPAAMERVIDARVAENLKCRVLAEGANGPTTPDADLVLEKRHDEVFLIPDILCNSGGVVVSYFEWVQDLQQLGRR